MIWLTWRQFRLPVAAVLAGIAVIGVVLLITGLEMSGETNFSDQGFVYGGTLLLMYLLPAVVGFFWGVPMVTREIETGTHSLVWNQTVTRKRWLGTKLGFGVLAAMVATGLLTIAVSWWASPIDSLADQSSDPEFTARMSPLVFAARGVAPIGYAAFAFVLGVAVAIVLRRTVAAMAVTIVVFTAVMVAVPFLVRPYILPTSEMTVEISTSNLWQLNGTDERRLEELTVLPPAGSWGLTNETVDSAGNAISQLPSFMNDCLPGPPPARGAEPPSSRGLPDCLAQLTDAGYRQHLVYHPVSQFWPMQWIELAFFLALSALLTWFCFRRIRHLS
jgi:hypothetical protein